MIQQEEGIINGSKVKVKENSAEIVVFPEMIAGQYKNPVKFGRLFNNSLNEQGFSDHLPFRSSYRKIHRGSTLAFSIKMVIEI
ncbi:MAG TPA: hypothetical protein VKA95_09615 [Nitrososphaeraceae archaeon]|jgi:predicted amidohydrolase|nr:hypothetical protein [Nitrososphaeraceae archaeon]